MKKIKISIPDYKIFDLLTSNADIMQDKYDFQIIRTSENQAAQMFAAGKTDAALVTPLSYGRIFRKGDFRIIPLNVIAMVGYTGYASLIFQDNLKEIDKIGVFDKNDFLVNIGMILLSERYNIFPEQFVLKNNSDIPQDVKILIKYLDSTTKSSIDISEDWFETYEMPLPLAFWICRNEEQPENIQEIIKSLAENSISDEVITTISTFVKNEEILREGSILTNWSDDFKDSLDQTLQLLYFHQLIDEIPQLKFIE